MYIYKLLMDGERKSIEPMANRVSGWRHAVVATICESESLVSSGGTEFAGMESEVSSPILYPLN